MSLKVAINGCGRVGRGLLRAYVQRKLEGLDPNLNLLELCAINERMPLKQLAHLIQYDSTYGKFPIPIESDGRLKILDQDIQVLNTTGYNWPWQAHGIDVVVESTGQFRKINQLRKHLEAGAAGVVLTAPLLDELGRLLDPSKLGAKQIIPSMPWPESMSHEGICTTHSCTTQAIVTLLHPLLGELEIENLLVSEIHGYTNDQNLLDSQHVDWRRGRSATQSIVPTPTQGIESSGFVLPELSKQKLQGYSFRVPTVNVACVELTLGINKCISSTDLIQLYQKAIEQKKIRHLCLSHEPLVSIDYLQHPASAIVDLELIQTQGKLVKILAWYDNEWAYALRLLDLLSQYAARKNYASQN